MFEKFQVLVERQNSWLIKAEDDWILLQFAALWAAVSLKQFSERCPPNAEARTESQY
jgi:hypothetical protein